ncbi:glycosylhydrolase-like jelly roll fold domain-containing protein, partial [Candidatus Poribacteria bacterium]
LTRLQPLSGAFAVLNDTQLEALKAAQENLLVPNVRIDRREVTYMHREVDGKHLYFLASDSDKPLDACIQMRVSGKVEEWDLETGQIRCLLADTDDNGYTRVDWSFAPHGSVMLVVDPDQMPLGKEPAAKNEAHRTRIQLEDTWEFTCVAPNALILDRWKVQLLTQGDWLYYDYTTHVRIDSVPESLNLLLDDIESRGSFMMGMSFRIYINDQEISAEPGGHYIDPKWRTFDITGKVQPGQNRIRLRFTNQSWAGEPKAMTIPPKLLGNFALVSDGDSGYRISVGKSQIQSRSSWTDQGYPFYSGAAIYTQQVTLDEEFLSDEQVWIELTEVADMVEFIINGTSTEVHPWPPYRCEIRSLLSPGQNTIALKITNSMQNFLEGKAKPSGLLGCAFLHY